MNHLCYSLSFQHTVFPSQPKKECLSKWFSKQSVKTIFKNTWANHQRTKTKNNNSKNKSNRILLRKYKPSNNLCPHKPKTIPKIQPRNNNKVSCSLTHTLESNGNSLKPKSKNKAPTAVYPPTKSAVSWYLLNITQVKSGDDLRQEYLAMQLIKMMSNIFEK